jgi:hypothetical protein
MLGTRLDGKLPTKPNAATLDLINAHVFEYRLNCGVRLIVSRQGFFVFDFAAWQTGAEAEAPEFPTMWQKLVFPRAEFMNLFLACFYTALYRIHKRARQKHFIDLSS